MLHILLQTEIINLKYLTNMHRKYEELLEYTEHIKPKSYLIGKKFKIVVSYNRSCVNAWKMSFQQKLEKYFIFW